MKIPSLLFCSVILVVAFAESKGENVVIPSVQEATTTSRPRRSTPVTTVAPNTTPAPPNVLQSLTICEHDRKTMACQEGTVIVISDAFYGRTDLTTCQYPGKLRVPPNTNCKAKTTLPILREKCEGKLFCDLASANNWFDDPCVGTYKYLKADYICLKEIPKRPGQEEVKPTTIKPTTAAPSTAAPTTAAPTTAAPTTKAPTTAAPTTKAPTTAAPTTKAPTTAAPTTAAPTTKAPTTAAPTTAAPTTAAPTTAAPTTAAPTTAPPQPIVIDVNPPKQKPSKPKFIIVTYPSPGQYPQLITITSKSVDGQDSCQEITIPIPPGADSSNPQDIIVALPADDEFSSPQQIAIPFPPPKGSYQPGQISIKYPQPGTNEKDIIVNVPPTLCPGSPKAIIIPAPEVPSAPSLSSTKEIVINIPNSDGQPPQTIVIPYPPSQPSSKPCNQNISVNLIEQRVAKPQYNRYPLSEGPFKNIFPVVQYEMGFEDLL